MAGFRIRLDLSDFIKDVGMHRVMFLPKETIRTVSDLTEKVRSEYKECSDDCQILLFIEDGFLIPSWEPIHILQQGDLVKVVLQEREKTKRKRESAEACNGEQKRKRVRETSPNGPCNEQKIQDSSEDSHFEQSHRKSSKILPKVFKNPDKKKSVDKILTSKDSSDFPELRNVSVAKTVKNKSESNETRKAVSSVSSSQKAGKKLVASSSIKKPESSDTSDSSSSSSDKAPAGKAPSSASAKKPESSSSSSSESSSDDETPVAKVKTAAPMRKPKSSSSSSSDSSSDDDDDDEAPAVKATTTATVRKPKVSPSSSSDSSSDDEAPAVKATTSAQAKKPESSSSSSSSSSSEDEVKSVTDRKSSVTVSRPPSNCMEISASVESKLSQPLANSTPAVGVLPTEPDGNKPRRKRKRKNKNKNKLPASELPVFEDFDVKQAVSSQPKKLVNTKTVFTDSCEAENSKTLTPSACQEEFSAEDIQMLYRMSKPCSTVKKKPETSQTTGNSHSVNQSSYMANLTKPDSESGNASILQMFGKKEKKKPSIIFKPRILNIQELKREKTVEPVNGVSNDISYPSTQQETRTDLSDVGLNGSSHMDTEDSIKGAKSAAEEDVYSNRSQIIENPKDYNAYHAVSSGGPRLHDIIAFKMIEMSENYTPGLSEFKEGKVISIQEDRVTFNILNQVKKKRTGRFELDPDSEATEAESVIEMGWSEVIDPRLVFP